MNTSTSRWSLFTQILAAVSLLLVIGPTEACVKNAETSARTERQMTQQSQSGEPSRSLPSAAPVEESHRAYIGVFACEQQPQVKRSAVMVSNTGARAYIEVSVRVVATGQDESAGEPTHKCRADWTLYVAAPNEKQFQAMPAHSFTENEFQTGFSTDASTYYGGSVLGWSPDENLLLAYAHIGAYEDWFLPIPVVYSASERKTWTVDLRPIFARQTPKDCDLHLDPLGFAGNGKVVFDAAPFEYVDQNCFKASRWLLDYRTKAVSPASQTAKAVVQFKTVVGKND